MLGDGFGSLQDRGRGRIAGGGEADVRGWVADARDRIDGHMAGAEPATALQVDIRGSLTPARVVPLPFYKRPKG